MANRQDRPPLRVRTWVALKTPRPRYTPTATTRVPPGTFCELSTRSLNVPIQPSEACSTLAVVVPDGPGLSRTRRSTERDPVSQTTRHSVEERVATAPPVANPIATASARTPHQCDRAQITTETSRSIHTNSVGAKRTRPAQRPAPKPTTS